MTHALCPSIPTPAMFVAWPSQAPLAWVILIGAAICLGAISPFVTRDVAPGLPRRLAITLTAIGALCVLAGEFILLDVASPWADALYRWYSAQAQSTGVNGCSLSAVDTAYSQASAVNDRLSMIGGGILMGSAIFFIALALLRIVYREPADGYAKKR